ncbi:hypothetical protein FHS95_000034 [Sphingomonas naasensis]|nr:hypothetical protein [Sphingomonas naasensis]NIJ18365.1 hypothetical protein [Sphingomonas naasensis]
MTALAAGRAFAPHTSRSPADLSARVAVSLSMLSWLGVVIALFWH